MLNHVLGGLKTTLHIHPNKIDHNVRPQPYCMAGPAHNQSQCAILTRLSAELRLLVYEAMLTQSNQLLHIVYCEAIDVLYNANTFSLKGAQGIIRFHSMVTPLNWDMIRHVNLSTVFKVPMAISPALKSIPPEYYSAWERACTLIGTLSGLRILNIDMTIWNYYDYRTTNTMEDKALMSILSPLRVLQINSLQVELNIELPHTVKLALEPYNFDVVQRHRPYNARVFRQA
ncbi:hypothetical protein FB567DRAFT_449814 [Paraphoma chrysanthemicola]|uniref:DUF7730 domain-containing protein n=1 Tax=Paraphoma chrysanthemicola TaxID=798071 RepID=A0A8K0QZ82_9PLEO|nr:hypothetical protein FB567DRAFT_449814 [Paraphoma chrysanthemicola]